MTLHTWASKWFTGRTGRRPAAAAKRSPRCRLAVEGLEERAVPAGLSRFATLSQLGQPASHRLVVTQLEKVGDVGVGAYGPQLVAAGNFNGLYDRDTDLFVTNADGSYSVLLGDGQGGFSDVRWGYYGFPLPGFVSVGGNGRIDGLASPEGVVAGDFNRDGLTDVAVAGYGDGNTPGAVKVLFGLGNGQFYVGSSLDLPAGAGPTYLTAADLDRDGNLDLVVSDFNNNRVLIYTGAGDGTFGLHDYNYAQNGVLNPNQAVVADFNGDGNLDIAVANKGNGSVSLFRGLGGGYITAAGNFALGGGVVDGYKLGSVGLAAGDLDGDGRPDLAVANFGTGPQGAHTLSLLRNTSTGGNFSFHEDVDWIVGDHLINVAIADFNRDGRLDVAVSSAGNTEDGSTADNRIVVLSNLGGGPGQINLGNLSYLTAGRNPVGLVSADLNGDGKADLVSTNQDSNDVSVFLDQTHFNP